ncbi:hypothetical protein F951_01425 [Acinetobacter soli CIP 110264]|uniref:hypothetical protein n=1 Tax=Acinetobacter soli TaxID=487316 RepID=UPI0002CD8EE5|nr:hypothetical protein [Acinetobacter soli]ENV57080.1 hypothetical protein F951_01425 [Acinetobacter soli CIP 110264]
MRIASILLLVIVLLTLLFFYFQPSETAIPFKQSTAQAQAGQLDQPSHLNNNITTQDVTSHSVTQAEQQASDSAPLADTKSDLSIQPIDPEKDPGNQIIKP